jgi:hypothetical protein
MRINGVVAVDCIEIPENGPAESKTETFAAELESGLNGRLIKLEGTH